MMTIPKKTARYATLGECDRAVAERYPDAVRKRASRPHYREVWHWYRPRSGAYWAETKQAKRARTDSGFTLEL